MLVLALLALLALLLVVVVVVVVLVVGKVKLSTQNASHTSSRVRTVCATTKDKTTQRPIQECPLTEA